MVARAIISMEVSLGDFSGSYLDCYSKLQDNITIFFLLRVMGEKGLATRET